MLTLDGFSPLLAHHRIFARFLLKTLEDEKNLSRGGKKKILNTQEKKTREKVYSIPLFYIIAEL
jgi:hypothetical protein